MSCEEPVELDIEGTETKLVLNSHFTPDQNFEAYISKSLFPNSKEFEEYLDDVEVQLYKGNEVLETLMPVDRFPLPAYPRFSYQSKNSQPEVGVEYTIRAKAPNLERVSATSSVPMPSLIKSFSMTNVKKEYPPGKHSVIDSTIIDYLFDLSIEIEATDDLPTYYHIDVYYEWVPYDIIQSDTVRTYTGDFIPIVLDDPEGEFNGLKHYDKGILVKHESPDDLVLNFKTRTPNSIQSEQDIFDKLYVDLRTVSKDYFLYHTNLTRQIEYDGGVLTEPVLLYNNVNNGFGIFAGYSLSRDSVRVHTQ